ncbi:MAG: pantetheine-phosphate adenylyltransferase [Bacteroidales bacterium]|nr:pantetheine-phosphate adenylyltransferase [Bacteroidales bacterium]
MKTSHNKTLLFPGSFDPFTIGHQWIVDRALTFADKVIIAIGINENKKRTFSVEETEASLKTLYQDSDRVEVITYTGLTIDVVKEVGANAIVRGVRSTIDFEYEKAIADTNRELSGVETILLFTHPTLSHISSSMVRELLHFGRDISGYLPRP